MQPSNDLERLAGIWRLVRFDLETQTGGARRPAFGDAPKGRLIILTSGLMMVVITASGRQGPKSAEDRASAFSSTVAYTGYFKLSGDRLTTDVDISWNEAWVDAPQARTFRFVGSQLELSSDWQPSPFEPGTNGRGVLLWEREG
jgi:hypothetical protein